MSAFNGAGTFIISGVGLPFVTGTTISSTVANQLNTDLAAGLSNCITKDGQTTPTANIPMGGFKLTGLGVATAPGDALSYGQPATVSNLTVTGTVTAAGVSSANKIINGDMRISQRFQGGAVDLTNTSLYNPDRFYGASSTLTTQTFSCWRRSGALAATTFSTVLICGGVAAPLAAGAACAWSQYIEGIDCVDMMWGTVSAKTVTLSFVAKSTFSGTYGVSFRNANGTRSYIGTYSVVANVEKQVSITVPGDTGGVWATDSSIGLLVSFECGVGANYIAAPNAWLAGNFLAPTGGDKMIAQGASIDISNVKLELGSVATTYAIDDLTVSMEKCWRYFRRVQPATPYAGFPFTGINSSPTNGAYYGYFNLGSVPMRSPPTVFFSGAFRFTGNQASVGLVSDPAVTAANLNASVARISTINFFFITSSTPKVIDTGSYVNLENNNDAGAYCDVNAEL